jgi:hypothetical protein
LFSRCLYYISLEDGPSRTPLEAAYYWAIACRSAVTDHIKFCYEFHFQINCQQLQKGRLFLASDPTSINNVSTLQKSVIYYVDESNGAPTHPFGNLFFLSDHNELVLVDITGGGKQTVQVKIVALMGWVPKIQERVSPYQFKAIVIAPNLREDIPMRGVNDIAIVSGDAAIALLGGLSQIVKWLEHGDEDKPPIM